MRLIARACARVCCPRKSSNRHRCVCFIAPSPTLTRTRRLIADSVGRTPQLALLDAQLAWRRHRNRPAQLAFLDEAVRLHMKRSGLDSPALTVAVSSSSAAARSSTSNGATANLYRGSSGGSANPSTAPSSAALSTPASLDSLVSNGSSSSPSSAPSLSLIPTRLPPPSCGAIPEWYADCSPLLLLDCAREYLQTVPEADTTAAAAAAGGSSHGQQQGHQEASAALISSIFGPPAAFAAAHSAGRFGSALGLPPHADATNSASSAFVHGCALAELAVSLLPSCLPGWMLLAQAHAAASSWEVASAAAAAAAACDPASCDALLLCAHVALARGDARSAATALDTALSQALSLQQSPVYLRVSACT